MLKIHKEVRKFINHHRFDKMHKTFAVYKDFLSKICNYLEHQDSLKLPEAKKHEYYC